MHDDGVPTSLMVAINEAALNAVNRVLRMLEGRYVKVQLDDKAFMPVRAHATDAGADILNPETFVLPAHSSKTVDTGVHVELPRGTKLDVRSKSGLHIKCDIVTDGLVDEGYTGSIRVRLHNLSETPHVFRRKDKIAQMVVTPVYYPKFVQVDEVKGGERGSDGFGSTGA